MSELDLTAIAASSINTPGTGVAASFIDSISKRLCLKDDTGFMTCYRKYVSTGAQTPAATTRTYITGSQVTLGSAKLQVGSAFRWRFNITKTAAGTATSTIDVAFGTTGTTSDTARLSFTKPAGTAAVDEGIVQIDCVIRSISATGVAVAEIEIGHNLATTGHMAQQQFVANAVSSSFDTTAPTFVGVCITTGASDAITIQEVITEVWDA